MAKPLSLSALFQDSLRRALQVIAPSLPFAVLYVAATGLLVWGAGALPENSAGFTLFAALAFATLFSHSLFSATMYRAVLNASPTLFQSSWKLTLAWLLMMVVTSIGATIIVLFFSLIGASLGVVSGEPGQEITDMTAQMQESGTFWPLFTLFIITLLAIFWFAVRMILFAAATVTTGKVHVFRSWSWTKGAFSRLAPLTIGLIILPLAILIPMAQALNAAILGAAQTPAQAGLSAALTALILLPSAWLGHGFAASALAQLMPKPDDQTTTPAENKASI